MNMEPKMLVDTYGYASVEWPVGDAPSADLHASDTDKREKQVVREVMEALVAALGYRSQGGSKWSLYAVGPAGEDLRVSNHSAFNAGSMGVDPAKRIGVQISEGAGELTVTSPAIRSLHARDDVTFVLSSEAFETMASPQSVAILASLIQTGTMEG